MKYKLLDPSVTRSERNAINSQISRLASMVPANLQYIVDRENEAIRHGMRNARAVSREAFSLSKREIGPILEKKKVIRNRMKQDLLIERARKEQLKQELKDVNENISMIRSSKNRNRAKDIMWRKIVDYPSEDYHHSAVDIFSLPTRSKHQKRRSHKVPRRAPPPPPIRHAIPGRAPPPPPPRRHAPPGFALPPLPPGH